MYEHKDGCMDIKILDGNKEVDMKVMDRNKDGCMDIKILDGNKDR